MQDKMRSPALDSYFAITANLGTHTFFMTALPVLFWCGNTSLGRGYDDFPVMVMHAADVGQNGSYSRDWSLLHRLYQGFALSPATSLASFATDHHVRFGSIGIRLPVDAFCQRSVGGRVRPVLLTFTRLHAPTDDATTP
jgi:hypothetical protein